MDEQQRLSYVPPFIVGAILGISVVLRASQIASVLILLGRAVLGDNTSLPVTQALLVADPRLIPWGLLGGVVGMRLPHSLRRVAIGSVVGLWAGTILASLVAMPLSSVTDLALWLLIAFGGVVAGYVVGWRWSDRRPSGQALDDQADALDER